MIASIPRDNAEERFYPAYLPRTDLGLRTGRTSMFDRGTVDRSRSFSNDLHDQEVAKSVSLYFSNMK